MQMERKLLQDNIFLINQKIDINPRLTKYTLATRMFLKEKFLIFLI